MKTITPQNFCFSAYVVLGVPSFTLNLQSGTPEGEVIQWKTAVWREPEPG
jgi:hypothetical protein